MINTKERGHLMRNLLLGCFVLGTLTGCTAQFWHDFKQNQAAWNDYVNSPAYYQTVRTSTVQTPQGTIQCTTTFDDRTGDSYTRCN